MRTGQVPGTTRCGKRRTKSPKPNHKRGCVRGCVRIRRKSFARGEGTQRSEPHPRVESVMKLSSNYAAVIVTICAAWLLAYCQPSFAQTGCGVNCVALSCWKNCDGNFYMTTPPQAKVVVNLWFNATAGCTPDKCNCTGTSENYFTRKCSATAGCNALCSGGTTNNNGQSSNCNTPTGGILGPFTGCAGCTPISSS